MSASYSNLSQWNQIHINTEKIQNNSFDSIDRQEQIVRRWIKTKYQSKLDNEIQIGVKEKKNQWNVWKIFIKKLLYFLSLCCDSMILCFCLYFVDWFVVPQDHRRKSQREKKKNTNTLMPVLNNRNSFENKPKKKKIFLQKTTYSNKFFRFFFLLLCFK